MKAHAYRGELDQAFNILEKGVEAGIGFPTFLYDPFLLNLHDDPRWLSLMHKAGYNPDS